MKKEKVLALLLTAAMCATTVAPVSAADFSDQTAVVETESTEEAQEAEAEAAFDTEETEPEVITDETTDDYEEGEAEDIEAAGTDVQALDFSDQITAVEEETNVAEAGAVAIKGTVQADGDSISGTIPAGASSYRYKVTLPTGGNLSLKGESSSNLECFIMDERENEIGKVYNFNEAYELAQGNYIILIRNNSKEYEGTFSLRTYFDTQGATTFPENSNDRIDTASPISLGQKIIGHTAVNN